MLGQIIVGESLDDELPELNIPEELQDQVSDELEHSSESWVLSWGEKCAKCLVGKNYSTPMGRVRVKQVIQLGKAADHPYSYLFSEARLKQIDREAKGRITHVEFELAYPDEFSVDDPT
jgi:hypothetical protein